MLCICMIIFHVTSEWLSNCGSYSHYTFMKTCFSSLIERTKCLAGTVWDIKYKKKNWKNYFRCRENPQLKPSPVSNYLRYIQLIPLSYWLIHYNMPIMLALHHLGSWGYLKPKFIWFIYFSCMNISHT